MNKKDKKCCPWEKATDTRDKVLELSDSDSIAKKITRCIENNKIKIKIMNKNEKKCCGGKKTKKCADKKLCVCEKLTLVKWDYEKQPKEWKSNNPNPFEKTHFVLFGKIKKMPGHLLCLDMETGKPYVFHTEDLIPLTKEDLI
jgi:hypothetical protein